jgi:hypothetical protein
LIKKDDANGNPWGVSFKQGLFNMTSDSALFHKRGDLEADGWTLDGNVFHRGQERMLPLYQGVMIDFYDHRAADVIHSPTALKRQNQPSYLSAAEKADARRLALPIYWVSSDVVAAELDGRWTHDWLSGFSRVTSPTNARSMVPTLIPYAGVGDNIFMLFADRMPVVLNAVLASIAFDYVTRQKIGGLNMNFFYVEQLPVPDVNRFEDDCPWESSSTVRSWIETRALELSFTAWDMTPFARELGDQRTPFKWDPVRRAILRAELDGALFHIFGLDRDDADYVLSTFPIVNRKDPELAGRVLDAYDQIAKSIETGRPFVSTLDPAPGFGPRHPER